jgi:D-beta-D-heptose 7-phosphate kinase/D-beta-D-heptose 1-phosphate adenosyltransferase
MKSKDYANRVKTLQELSESLESDYCRMTLGVACTTGAFDMVHPGHVGYLWRASLFCEYLIVGIDSDARIKAAKGKNRPLFNQEERANVIAGLRCVDYVTVFDNMQEFLDSVRPTVLIVSPTSSEDKDFDRIAYAKKRGIRIEVIPPQSTMHTSDYILRILSQCAKEQ